MSLESEKKPTDRTATSEEDEFEKRPTDRTVASEEGVGSDTELQRGLKNRHVQMIS